MTRSCLIRCWIAHSNSRTITPRWSSLQRTIRAAPRRKALASRRFCTAPALPVPGNAISMHWWAWKRPQQAALRVLVSSTEFGQGTNTILCQIAAETLGLEYDDVSMAPVDTSISPNSGPTVASRTAMIIGKIVQTAALKMRQTLIDSGLLEPDGRPRAIPRRLPGLPQAIWRAAVFQPL